MKNKKRYSFFKIFTLFSALLIPAVVAVSCGTPQSNKYIGSVSQFDSLKLDPNSTDASNPTVNFSYYQLLKQGSTPTTSLRYVDPSKPNEYQVPSTDEISKFTNTYGLAANALAYNIASKAAVFATTASNYNNSLPGKDKDPNAITLFTPDPTATDSNLINEFYQANANNLLIGDSENNIGFGITDVSFKFQTLSPTVADSKLSDIDARLNNTKYSIPAGTDLTANDTNNKLTKILKVTDINIYFRFFIAGSEGQGAPTRNSIIASNNSDYPSRVATLKDQWKSNFNGATLNTYAFDLQMQDMAARLSFTAVEQKKSDPKDPTIYKIEPSAITSIAPLALYNSATIGVANSKENSLKMDPTLFDKITDYSKIMDDGTNSNTDYTNFSDQQKQLQDVTNAFLNEINQAKPSVTDLKNKVIGGNKLNLTIEDYFSLYFKYIQGVSTPDTANTIFAPGFNVS